MTPLQLQMLEKIARNKATCINGAKPDGIEETITWTYTVIENDQDESIFDSLLTEGMVIYSLGGGVHSFVSLTQKGFNTYIHSHLQLN